MVDFGKRIGKSGPARPLDPVAIYQGLDRASDKGPLRPAQLAVLERWHSHHRGQRDTILKLHTGQGKTLIGLLILQAKLNEGVGPALYLCPNNFLIAQTCDQAKQFGLKVVTPDDFDGELPAEFLESKAILVTSVQKLFNGLTKFRLGPRSISIGSIVLDDAHACIDAIRDACAISLPSTSPAYSDLLALFSEELGNQGRGTFSDISRGEWDALLPVPYWAWIDKAGDAADTLSKHSEARDIKFAWPLLRDILPECFCLVSGTGLEIQPHLPPLELFGSYAQARCRIFMSATVTDDSFLVKGLGLSAATVRAPLVYEQERWSGEKMILIPSLIDPSLDRAEIVKLFAPPGTRRGYGIVALCPSVDRTRDWERYGAHVCSREDIYEKVDQLKAGQFETTIVLVNRYDGIDLPDSACRVLIVDSRPFAESMLERHLERCIGSTEAISTRVARRIEQGLGRAVRGEKDYCAIVLIGPDLVAQVKAPALRDYLSPQTRTQVEIGLDIAGYAKEDGGADEDPLRLLLGLLNQCLARDEGWKAFYADRMDSMPQLASPHWRRLDIYEKELLAERKSLSRNYSDAAAITQSIADSLTQDDTEKAWYLQEAARHLYRHSRVDSNTLQQVAHERNRFLLAPRAGSTIKAITPTPQRRVDKIVEWMSAFSASAEMAAAVESILDAVAFGVAAERFEAGLGALGRILGFATERPDKEWKHGPDNLWCLRDNEYIVFECKSQVEASRAEISKYEAEQMNSSAAWFRRYYPGAQSWNIMIVPTRKLSAAAALDSDVLIMRKRSLDALTKSVRAFFAEFRNVDLKTLSPDRVNSGLSAHRLSTDALVSAYTETVTR
jgi:replicative superfamily II helicase